MNYHKGFIAPLLLALIALLLIGGGAYVYMQNKQANQLSTSSNQATSTQQVSITASTTSHTIVSYDYQGFSPKSITVPLGTTVTFVNQSTKSMWVASDPHPIHTAYSGTSLSQHCPDTTNSSFDECAALAPSVVSASNPYNAPSSFSFTFNKEGTWKYHNHLDHSQTGTVIVVAGLRSLGGLGSGESFDSTPVSNYAVDNSAHAYYDGKLISADGTTLEILKGSLTIMKGYISYLYARDAHTVYYAGEPLPGAAPATFQPIENGAGAHYYGTDGRTVYFGSKPIAGADPKTFKILWQTIYEGCSKSNYTEDATHVYYGKFDSPISTFITPSATTIVPGADSTTFVSLLNGFGKDNRGYYKGATYIGPTIDQKELVCTYG